MIEVTNMYDIPAAFATVQTYCTTGSGLAFTFGLVVLGIAAVLYYGGKAVKGR